MSEQEWFDGRLNTFSEYYDLTLKKLNVERDFYLKDRAFENVISDYLKSLDEMKKYFKVEDKIKRFRIASITTLCLIEHQCILPKIEGQLPVAYLINELYAINCSLGRLNCGLKVFTKSNYSLDFFSFIREIKKELDRERKLNISRRFIYKPFLVEALALFYKIFKTEASK